MATRKNDPPRGLLHPREGERAFLLRRYQPSEDLQFWVEHYWSVAWDLHGRGPFTQKTLPHPSVVLAVESGSAVIVGVTEGRFQRVLEGKGRVFGIKFRPGGFAPFVAAPVSKYRNRHTPLTDVFGDAGRAYAESVVDVDDSISVVHAERFLRGRKPSRDENVEKAAQIVARAAADRGILRVNDLLDPPGMSKRTLQRLFHRYVGVSPKWVIQRYRIHEALETIERGDAVDWLNVAMDLGYFDQAHFIKDFKALVGQTPTDYARGPARENRE